MPYPDYLKKRLGFLRPAVQAYRRRRVVVIRRSRQHAARLGRLWRHSRRRAVRNLKTRAALMNELDRRDKGYEKRIAQLQSGVTGGIAQIQTKKVVRRQLDAIRAEIANIERHEYGSYTPGVPGWHEKWLANPERRVLMFARKDFSGSLFKWAEAINDYTPWAARLAVLERHPYGYGNDLVFPLPEFAASELPRLIEESTVFHLKDENGRIDGSLRLPPDFFSRHGRPMVFTHYGGFARSLESQSAYREYVLGFDARVAMTPDLLYPWFDGVYIPHAIDLRSNDVEWTPGQLLSHSPSNPARKGTDELERAVKRVQADVSLDFDLISGVPIDECLRRKRRATLFFDQAGRESRASLGVSTVIGWYGNSALEAAVHGIPTMAHLSESALQMAHASRGAVIDEIAILNTPLDASGIEQRLRWFFGLTPEEQESISIHTRKWIEAFHSYEATATELQGLYESITTP